MTTQQSLSTIDLELSEDCLGRLRRQRPETLAGAYVVQEVLVAQISEQTCGRVDTAGRFVGFGAAEAEYEAACAMESLEPVAVGYRTVPLSRLMDGALPPLPPPSVAAPGRPPRRAASASSAAVGPLSAWREAGPSPTASRSTSRTASRASRCSIRPCV